jgi:hypothetical protein
VKKIEVPLYAKSDRRGRPVKYDFTPFAHPKTQFIVLKGYGIECYSSIRSTLCRWKRLTKNKDQMFTYDYHPYKDGVEKHWVIWRK